MTRFLPEDRRARAAIFLVAAVAGLLIVTQFILPGGTGPARGTPAAILFTGFCAGAVTALPACGMVLLYRTMRIINFMQTALGVAGAVLIFEFIQYTPVPFPIAFLIGLAVSTGVGVVAGVILLRFFKASRLLLTVVTIMGAASLSGVSRSVRNLPFFPPSDQRTSSDDQLAQNVDRLLPFEGWRFQVGDLPINFGFAEVFSLEMAVIALLGLGFFLRFTRSGVAVRALSENSERASLLGIGVGKLSILVWGVAGLLSGVGVVLNGAITTPATATTVDLTVLVAVLAAAVIGGMTNLPVTIAASVFIGVLDQAWEFSFRNNQDTFNAVLFVLVAAGLLFQRRGGRSEGGQGVSWAATEESRPVPKELAGVSAVRLGRLALIGTGALIVLVFPFVAPTGRVVLAGVIAINTIAVMSLVVLTGWAGQVSLGQYAFVAIGSVLGGSLTARAGVPFWFAVPIASAVTGAIAVIVGIPALRIRGLFLLVATFAFATAVQTNIFDDRYFGWLLPDAVERPTLFFLNFEDERSMYFLAVVALASAMVVVANLRRSRVGRILIAARENEPNLQSFGVNLFRTKLLAFAISGAMAGFAGALLSHHQRGVTSASYPIRTNLELFTQAVFGGVSSMGGALLGSAFYNLSEEFITSAFVFQIVSTTIPLMLIFAAPGGLISLINAARDSVLRVIAQRRGIVVPSLFADYDPDVLERRLIPLGDALDNGGLAALPASERFVMESDLYQGRGERVIDRIGPQRESDDTTALGAAARSAAELEVPI